MPTLKLLRQLSFFPNGNRNGRQGHTLVGKLEGKRSRFAKLRKADYHSLRIRLLKLSTVDGNLRITIYQLAGKEVELRIKGLIRILGSNGSIQRRGIVLVQIDSTDISKIDRCRRIGLYHTYLDG